MSFVEVVRGGVTESRHAVSVAVLDARGALLASVGDPSQLAFFRSAAKPLQALPLVEEGVADRLGMSDEEIALCCASHEGTVAHVKVARAILSKAGLGESALRCGPQAPYSARAQRALFGARRAPRRIHNNCSGKHAGMLALSVGMGWNPIDYHLEDHPVQRRMLREVARWSGTAETDVVRAIDGCGVPCFAVPLTGMAASFARFAAAAHAGEGAARIVRAMTGHPFMVGGEGRTCTDVMAVSGERVFVKLGAEGVYAGGAPAEGLGFAIKVEDGGRRAVEVALVHVLSQLGLIDPDDAARLRPHGRPEVRNTRGETVGEIRPAFSLEAHRPGGRGARAIQTILER